MAKRRFHSVNLVFAKHSKPSSIQFRETLYAWTLKKWIVTRRKLPINWPLRKRIFPTSTTMDDFSLFFWCNCATINSTQEFLTFHVCLQDTLSRNHPLLHRKSIAQSLNRVAVHYFSAHAYIISLKKWACGHTERHSAGALGSQTNWRI